MIIILFAFENGTGNFVMQLFYKEKRCLNPFFFSYYNGLPPSQMCSGCCRLLGGGARKGRGGTVHIRKSTT